MDCKRSSKNSQRELQCLKQQIDDLAKQMEECGILPKGTRSTRSRVVYSSKVEYEAPYARSKHSNKKNGKKVQKDFLASDYKGDSINNLEGVKQGSMDVLDYTIEFKWPLWKNGLKEDDPRILVYYFLLFNDYIRRVVVNQPFTNLEELSSLALDVGRQRRCCHCQSLGHIDLEYPNKKKDVSLVEYQTHDNKPFEEEKEEEVGVDMKEEEFEVNAKEEEIGIDAYEEENKEEEKVEEEHMEKWLVTK